MDEKIVGLLGIAEHFRVTNNIKKCIQCLQGEIHLHFVYNNVTYAKIC